MLGFNLVPQSRLIAASCRRRRAFILYQRCHWAGSLQRFLRRSSAVILI